MVFHSGLNFTVRAGVKWASLIPGELITIGNQFAEIDMIYICRFDDIPFSVYLNEHDPKCQDGDGDPNELLIELKRIYPNGNWDSGKQIVTCIGFHFRGDIIHAGRKINM